MGRVIVVELDVKAGKVPLMLFQHACDERLGRDALLFRAQHDRRAMGVVGADVMHLVPTHLLEAHPDIGLNVFDQVAEMDRAVCVRQRRRDQDAACGHASLKEGKEGELNV